MGDTRTIQAHFDEDTRACSNTACGKKLTGQNGMLYIVIPGSAAYEFCSWKCMYLYMKNMLGAKVAAQKQMADNRLTALGYSRYWDGITPLDISEDLQKPIEGN